MPNSFFSFLQGSPKNPGHPSAVDIWRPRFDGALMPSGISPLALPEPAYAPTKARPKGSSRKSPTPLLDDSSSSVASISSGEERMQQQRAVIEAALFDVERAEAAARHARSMLAVHRGLAEMSLSQSDISMGGMSEVEDWEEYQFAEDSRVKRLFRCRRVEVVEKEDVSSEIMRRSDDVRMGGVCEGLWRGTCVGPPARGLDENLHQAAVGQSATMFRLLAGVSSSSCRRRSVPDVVKTLTETGFDLQDQ